MSVPLYDTDVQKIVDRTPKTALLDTDVFVVADEDGTLAPITKVNTKETLGINANTTAITTLNGDVSTAGSVLKVVKDNAKDATFTPTRTIAATDIKGAIAELDSDISTLAGAGRTIETVKQNADDISAIKGTGYTSGTLKSHEDRLDTLEGTVDTNRLYSDSQYLALKAKADSLQVKCNTLQAEVYTDDPILQYGAVEIIGKGYEADATPIDVSANVVDGKLSMEQNGLTIRNGVVNGSFESDFNSWTLEASNTFSIETTITKFGGKSAKIIAVPGTQSYCKQRYNTSIGDVLYVSGWCYKVSGTGLGMHVYNKNEVFGPLAALMLPDIFDSMSSGSWQYFGVLCTATSDGVDIGFGRRGAAEATAYFDGISITNLTALGLSTITDTAILAKLLPYVDGTKSVGKMGIQILDADDAVTQTIFLPTIGNSLPNGVADSIKTVSDGWKHSKRVSTPASVGSGVAVNTTNYQTAKNGGQWVNELTAGGTEIGVVGTDSTTGAGMLRFELATPIVTKYDLPHLTSGKTIHRFAGEEKIALYGTGLTFSENVLSVLSAVKFVAGVMTDITSLATITGDTVTFSGVDATDVVYAQVEHDVDRPLGVLEHTPTVSNTASRLADLEARVTALEV